MKEAASGHGSLQGPDDRPGPHGSARAGHQVCDDYIKVMLEASENMALSA